MTECSWRVLLLVALALLTLVAFFGLCKTINYSEVRYSAALALSIPASDTTCSPNTTTKAVKDFVQSLSDEEVLGWKRTPRYTRMGYKTEQLPLEIRQSLRRFHETSSPETEEPNGHLQGNILLASLANTNLEAKLVGYLETLLSAWTGESALEFVNSYGPRTYTRGSTLAAHGDRIKTHAVSAIVFVAAANVEEPWALQFVPNGADGNDKVHEVFLDAEHDVLLYESTQPHGRVDPLRGDSFSAVFLHWKPKGWQQTVERLLDE